MSKEATNEEETMRRVLTILLVALAALVPAACSGGDDESGAEGVTAEAEALEASGSAGGQSRASDGDATAVSEQSGQSALPPAGPKVVQTASLALSVPRDRFSERVDEARSLAAGLGGFVVSSTASQGGDRKLERGTLVLRVPARSYAQAMQALGELGRVESSEESGQDVSQELVDLGARERHLQAVERQLLELLRRARSVSAALAVQERLNEVQLQLEQVRGRSAYLDDQVAYATISLALHERGVPAASGGGGPWGIVDAWRTAVHSLVTVVGWVLVGVVTLAPVILLAVLALLAGRYARRAVPAWRKP